MIFLEPGMECDEVVNELILHDYQEEFCLSTSFDPGFIRSLMNAGFLVMSFKHENDVILLPKLHLERSILFFKNLHVSKSVKGLLPRYILKPYDSVYSIMEACVAAHGDEWLTKPLRDALCNLAWPPVSIRNEHRYAASPQNRIFCIAFGLYRDTMLVSGEFGVVAGRVYTSYSGFYKEKSSGTVQMVLTARFLEAKGYAFWDLGMPLEYKSRLGAIELDRKTFIQTFREARELRPVLPHSEP